MPAYVGEVILVAFNFAPNGYALCNGQLLSIAQNNALFALLGTIYGGDGVSTFAVPDLRGRVAIHQGTGGGGSTFTLGQNDGSETVTLSSSHLPAHTHAIDISGMTATARCSTGAANQVTPVGNVFAIEAVATFTDPSLTVGSSQMRAVHVVELRARINAMRTHFSLAPFSYTTPSLTEGATMILAQHIVDLRTALAGVYTAAGLPQPGYTDPGLAAGTSIKAVHVTELRNAVLAVPGVGGVMAPYSSTAADANMHSTAATVSGTVTAAAAGGNIAHENRQPFLTLNYCIALTGQFPSQS
jgi:microcystin-dependent protein